MVNIIDEQTNLFYKEHPISKVINCDFDTYKTQFEYNIDNERHSTLYLVNQNDNLEIYYGNKRCSDIYFVTERPDSTKYPDSKIYIQNIYNDKEEIIGYYIYYKFNGQLITLQSENSLSGVEIFPNYVSFSVSNSKETKVAKVPILDSNENLPDDIIDKIIDKISTKCLPIWKVID